MEENHLSLETLAKWLSGRLEHDAVLQQIVPHLVLVCPVCRERYEQIRQLQREAGHEDEEVGVVEWREAPRGGGRLPRGAAGVREAPDALQRGAGRARPRAAAGPPGAHRGAEAPLGRAGERLRVARDPPRS